MKKEAKVEFGITITKPWSKEMYAHNDALAEDVKETVMQMWKTAYNAAADAFVDEDDLGNEFSDMDWSCANDEMVRIQRAITCYSDYHAGIEYVAEDVETTLEDMPLYQLKELVEELEIKLDKGFVGFS